MTNYDAFKDNRLLDVENGYLPRLREFLKMDNELDFNGKRILVAGSALGGESFAALILKAIHVTGIEIDQKLVLSSIELAKLHLPADQYEFILFNGVDFPEVKVDIVLSGHVIEHTSNWKKHLDECFKVLNDSGKIYLEFPTRFNWRELHTGLYSFEYFPSFFRKVLNLTSAYLAKISGNSINYGKRIDIQTTLQQVSTPQIKAYAQKNHVKVLQRAKPVKGIIRLILSR
jgi:SAM-dependent methyltransferase